MIQAENLAFEQRGHSFTNASQRARELETEQQRSGFWARICLRFELERRGSYARNSPSVVLLGTESVKRILRSPCPFFSRSTRDDDLAFLLE